MILKNTKLKNELKKLLNDNLKDILIFGSTVKGKDHPKDTDILIIFKKEIDKEIEYKIKKILEKYTNDLSLISKKEQEILDPSFDVREAVLFEAISLITNKNLAANYGFNSYGLFKYNFFEWNKSEKTKFYYALNGRRGSKGVFQELECIKFSDQIVLVPLQNIEKFKNFLDSWKFNYKYIPLLLPLRLSKAKFLEA